MFGGIQRKENKQIESSRFEGVSCSVLVVEYGHLAVTKRKASEEWLHAFPIFKPIEKNEKNYPNIEYIVSPLDMLDLQQPGSTRKRAETTTAKL